MQVILLERVAKLGQMGDVVDVKPGYARNFLLPQGKAKSASELNIAAFASNVLGTSNVPTFTIIELGRDGLSVPIAVPHLSQK